MFITHSKEEAHSDAGKHSYVVAVSSVRCAVHSPSFPAPSLMLGPEPMASHLHHCTLQFYCSTNIIYLPAFRIRCCSNGQKSPALWFIVCWFFNGQPGTQAKRPLFPGEHIWMMDKGELPPSKDSRVSFLPSVLL